MYLKIVIGEWRCNRLVTDFINTVTKPLKTLNLKGKIELLKTKKPEKSMCKNDFSGFLFSSY